MAMNNDELEKLRKSANAAGIELNIPEEIDTEKPASPTGKAAGYDEVDPCQISLDNKGRLSVKGP